MVNNIQEVVAFSPKQLDFIQDVLDRFLYLDEEAQVKYMKSLKELHKQERFAVPYKVVKGTRVYKKII